MYKERGQVRTAAPFSLKKEVVLTPSCLQPLSSGGIPHFHSPRKQPVQTSFLARVLITSVRKAKAYFQEARLWQVVRNKRSGIDVLLLVVDATDMDQADF